MVDGAFHPPSAADLEHTDVLIIYKGDAAYLGELDAQTIKTNAMREAWGYQVQAFDMRNQAAIDRKAATNQVAAGQAAGTAANIGAATTLLTGGSSLLQARYGFTK